MSLEVKLKTTALTWDLTLCSRMKFGTKSVQTPDIISLAEEKDAHSQ